MCFQQPKAPSPPPPPPPPPDFSDEQVALAQQVSEQERRRVFAGLSSTIATSAQGVLNPGRTTLTAGKGGY